MGKLKWHKRDHHALLYDVRELTLEERGAYNTILDLIYQHDGALKDDDRFICGWLGCDGRVWKRLKASLIGAGKLYLCDGKIHNETADEVASHGLDLVEIKAQARRGKGGKQAEQSSKNNKLKKPPENHPRVDSEIKESPNGDSPPISPRSAVDDCQSDLFAEQADPELSLRPAKPSQSEAVVVAYGSTPSIPAKREEAPHDEAAAIWNEICGDMMPNCRDWTKDRSRAFAARFKKNCKGNIEVWRDICRRIRASDFCCGYNDRGWRADIDFAMREKSWVRVLEGKYDNVKNARTARNGNPIEAIQILRNRDEHRKQQAEADGIEDDEPRLLPYNPWETSFESKPHRH